MGWPRTFLEALAGGRVSLSFGVETFRNFLDEGVGGTDAVWVTGGSGRGAAVMVHDSIRVGGQAVSIGSWSYGAQSWAFRLSTPVAGVAEQALRAGTFIRLRAGLAGQSFDQWAIIQSGMVHNVRRVSHAEIEVSVWDMITSLRQRASSTTADVTLFNTVGSAVALTSAYTVGDGTLNLTTTAGIERKPGGTGVVLVSPDSGSPFYLTYTGIVANSLTGCSALGAFGTTAGNSSLGPVANAAYLYDRPDQIVARILTATGDQTNGTYDVYPKMWGYALTDTEIVDTSDIVLDWGNAVLGATAGTYSWDVVVDDERLDGLSWLSSLLSSAGMWLCQRQGRITLRGAQDPHDPLSTSDVHITDSHIISWSVDWYDSQSPSEYMGIDLDAATSSLKKIATIATSAPAQGVARYDMSDRVRSNEASILAEVADRVWPWLERRPERIVVKMSGMWWAQLAPGDLPLLTSSQMRGRLKSTAEGYVRRRVMVVDVQPDWINAVTTLRLANAPIDDNDEWGV